MCAKLRMCAKGLGVAPIGRHGHVFAMPASLCQPLFVGRHGRLGTHGPKRKSCLAEPSCIPTKSSPSTKRSSFGGLGSRPHRVSSGYWRRFVSRSVAKSHEDSAAVHATRPPQKGIETYRLLACHRRTLSRGIGHLVPRGGGHCDPLRCGCSTTPASLSPKRSLRERRASSRSQSGAIMVNQVSGLSMSR